MSRATATKQRYEHGVLQGRKLNALLDEFNQGVVDDHAVSAKLDADGGVTDTDYEAQLTALEVAFDGYTLSEATGAQGQLNEFGADEVSEELFTTLVEQMNARVTDIRAIAAKLNADGTVNLATYDVAEKRVANLSQRLSDGAEAQDAVGGIVVWSTGEVWIATDPAGAAASGYLWRSDDGGRTFTKVADLPAALETVNGLLWDASREAWIVFGAKAADIGLYRSTDGGDTWEDLDESTFDTYTTILSGIVLSSGTILIGSDTDAPVFRSTDGGDSWTEVATLANAATVDAFLEVASGKVFVGTGASGRLYESSDGGATFTETNDFSAAGDTISSIIETQAGNLVVLYDENAGSAGIAVSSDGGATWGAEVALPGAEATASLLVQGLSGYIYIFNGAGSYYVSDDEGATIEAGTIDTPANDSAVQAVGRLPSGEIIFGSLNTTDEAGVFIVQDIVPVKLAALGETAVGEYPIEFPAGGGGVSARLLTALEDIHNRLCESWHNVCGLLDGDSGVTDTDYEAQLSAEALSTT